MALRILPIHCYYIFGVLCFDNIGKGFQLLILLVGMYLNRLVGLGVRMYVRLFGLDM
jgi:hypothetical protein